MRTTRQILRAFACGAALLIAGVAAAKPSESAMRKAFTASLAGAWGDMRKDGYTPGPLDWSMFPCGDQPAFVIEGNDRAGFIVKMNSMETGPLDGALVLSGFDSKTSARVVLPDNPWERRLSYDGKDKLVLDNVEAAEGAPTKNARYLTRCKR